MILSEDRNTIELFKKNNLTDDVVGAEPDTLVYPFGPYEIVILISPTGEFRQVTEVRIAKDFLSLRQKSASKKYHDISAFYD